MLDSGADIQSTSDDESAVREVDADLTASAGPDRDSNSPRYEAGAQQRMYPDPGHGALRTTDQHDPAGTTT